MQFFTKLLCVIMLSESNCILEFMNVEEQHRVNDGDKSSCIVYTKNKCAYLDFKKTIYYNGFDIIIKSIINENNNMFPKISIYNSGKNMSTYPEKCINSFNEEYNITHEGYYNIIKL